MLALKGYTTRYKTYVKLQELAIQYSCMRLTHWSVLKMEFNTVVFVVISLAIGGLCKVPKWHRPFERRFNALEKKVNAESLEFRDEILWLLEKMNDYHMNAYNKSDGGVSEKSEVDNKGTAAGDVAEAIAEALIVGFRAEKEYVRRRLLEFEQLVVNSEADLSQSLKTLEKGLRDEIFTVKHALDREIASGVQVMLEKEQSHADILKRIDYVENGLDDKITTKMSNVEAKTAEEMGEMKENLKAECRNELYQAMQNIKEELEAKIALVKVELLDNMQEFGERYQRKCGSWHSFMDSCYFISTESTTWEKARESCSGVDSYLTEVDNVDEAVFLRKIAKESYQLFGGIGPWIGGSDASDEGIWIWSYSGRRIDNVYTDWGSFEPNGVRKENCLHMYSSVNFKWNDTPCDNHAMFICEK